MNRQACRPTPGRYFTATRPTPGRYFTATRPILYKHSANTTLTWTALAAEFYLPLPYWERLSVAVVIFWPLNSKPIEYWRVGALKVATEQGSNLLSSKEATMATEPQPHLQAPVNTTLNRKYQCVELILTQKMWEGGREGGKSKQARLAEQLQQCNSSKSTWQCPCRPPWIPPPDPGEMAALARF